MDRIPNSKKNHPALFVMAPVSNTRIDDEGIDDDVTNSNEPGLSSAMHDIRMLAKSYQREPSPTLELGGVTMNASYLLQPTTTPRRESWKSIALGLMVLLGLSTSALALTLFSGLEEDRPEFAPVPLQLETSSFDAPEEVQHEQVLASEPPIYRVATAPEIAIPAPEVRESKAPVSTRQAVRKPLASKARSSFDKIDTCDEVACLLDGSDACCAQYESVQATQPIVSEERYRPYRLTRTEIMQPMQSIRGRVVACADSYGYAGVATVKVVVSPLGAVSSVALSDGTSDFQACVETHVKTLSFPELLQPFSFAYPFTL